MQMSTTTPLVSGSGLGYRRSMTNELLEQSPSEIDFMEVAPENWIDLGGTLKNTFKTLSERYPFILHGLSLSIGSPSPLDETLVRSIGQFMKEYNIAFYTEHLSYCSDTGHMYDLMPIPFTQEAADYTAERIIRVQDILGQRIGMENVSYYATPNHEMSELDFVNYVLEKADCGLLLDVNNIYVNSINQQYDPVEFLKAMPTEQIMLIHTAGHYDEADDLRIDTHGADVIDPVWDLLDLTYQLHGVKPTLLERDFNIPPIQEMINEVNHIKLLQEKWEVQSATTHRT